MHGEYKELVQRDNRGGNDASVEMLLMELLL